MATVGYEKNRNLKLEPVRGTETATDDTLTPPALTSIAEAVPVTAAAPSDLTAAEPPPLPSVALLDTFTSPVAPSAPPLGSLDPQPLPSLPQLQTAVEPPQSAIASLSAMDAVNIPAAVALDPLVPPAGVMTVDTRGSDGFRATDWSQLPTDLYEGPERQPLPELPSLTQLTAPTLPSAATIAGAEWNTLPTQSPLSPAEPPALPQPFTLESLSPPPLTETAGLEAGITAVVPESPLLVPHSAPPPPQTDRLESLRVEPRLPREWAPGEGFHGNYMPERKSGLTVSDL